LDGREAMGFDEKLKKRDWVDLLFSFCLIIFSVQDCLPDSFFNSLQMFGVKYDASIKFIQQVDLRCRTICF